MDEVQASVLNEKLKNINQTIKKRKLLANLYDKLLDKIIKIPERRANEERIYYTYTIKVNKKYRKKLQEFLFSKNIETKIYYDKLIPEVDPYKKFNFKSDIKNAKKISKEVLCLPMHENLNTNQIYYVCEKVKEFFNG